MDTQIKEFAKIRKDYIMSQSIIIDKEITALKLRIANGTDVNRSSAKIFSKLLGAIVDEELYDYMLVEPLAVSTGVSVGTITKVNGGEVNIVDLKFNSKPVELKHLSKKNIDKIVQRFDLNNSYTDQHSLDYKVTILGDRIQMSRMTQNEVRVSLANQSLLSRIKYTEKLLDLFNSDNIVKKITSFMCGRYQLVEDKIRENLFRQIYSYVTQFKKLVRHQPFVTSRTAWNGIPGNHNNITSAMINCEVNCLYKEIVLRQIHFDFDLEEADFNTSTAKCSLVIVCNDQIRALNEKKLRLSDL